jgi:hypothetical protein
MHFEPQFATLRCGLERMHMLMNIRIVSFLAAFFVTSLAGAGTEDAGNYTPGIGLGNHGAYVFSPFLWQIRDTTDFDGRNNGEFYYKKHASDGGQSGQQYEWHEFMERANASASPPSQCNLITFHDIIAHSASDVGTLYIVTHGGSSSLAVEAYSGTLAGKAARDARLAAYEAGDIAGQPALQEGDLTDLWSSVDKYYAIAVTTQYLEREINLPGALVYLGSCSSAALTDVFTAGETGARVALGNRAYTTPAQNRHRVKTFFASLDGRGAGQAGRVVSVAAAQIVNTVKVTGKQNTTLAPSVLEECFDDVECPSIGESIDIKFDTACDTGLTPDLDAGGSTWTAEWIDPFTLRATLTGYDQTKQLIILEIGWEKLKSARNEARLDGNTKPDRKNAKGEAHDDYRRGFRCERQCSGDVDGNDLVEIGDLLGLISGWDTEAGDQNGDGTTDIMDLLIVLDAFGTICVGGSCCLGEYCLDDTSEDDCLDALGVWGEGSPSCEGVECDQSGACCFGTSCDLTLGQDECEEGGGAYFEGADTCVDTGCVVAAGSCCLGLGDCLDLVQEYDCDYMGGIFTSGVPCDSGLCDPIDVPGACCLDDGTCESQSSIECTIMNGMWQGEIDCSQASCGTTGACCIDGKDTPMCIDAIVEADCVDTGGTFYAAMSCDDLYSMLICMDVGMSACCVDGGCVDSTESGCADMGGTWSAGYLCDEAPCDNLGACCTGSDCVDNVLEGYCDTLGGAFYPGGSCANVPCF